MINKTKTRLTEERVREIIREETKKWGLRNPAYSGYIMDKDSIRKGNYPLTVEEYFE